MSLWLFLCFKEVNFDSVFENLFACLFPVNSLNDSLNATIFIRIFMVENANLLLIRECKKAY